LSKRVNTGVNNAVSETSAPFSPAYALSSHPNWTWPSICHFDLNWEDVENHGLNGPQLIFTSNADQAPTEYALSYTSTPPPASQTTSTTTTNTTSPSNHLNSDNSGLSIGGIVGIAIGVLAGVIAFVALGLMVWRNRRKMKKLESQALGPSSLFDKPQGVEAAPHYGDGMNTQTSSPQTAAMEMPLDTAVVELPSYQAPHELRV
jgi:hypothetical protein